MLNANSFVFFSLTYLTKIVGISKPSNSQCFQLQFYKGTKIRFHIFENFHILPTSWVRVCDVSTFSGIRFMQTKRKFVPNSNLILVVYHKGKPKIWISNRYANKMESHSKKNEEDKLPNSVSFLGCFGLSRRYHLSNKNFVLFEERIFSSHFLKMNMYGTLLPKFWHWQCHPKNTINAMPFSLVYSMLNLQLVQIFNYTHV